MSKWLPAVAWTALAFVPALGQDDGSGYVTGLSLEELFDIEITIASKTQETTANAPSAATVITRDQIERMGVSNLQELLNFVPGFQSTRDIRNGQVAATQARGRSKADISNDVLVLIDGQRINTSHDGGANIFSRLMTLGNIKQVEVIRGPGSALYGSNAFLGVVNVVTDNGLNEARVRSGENNAREISAAYANQWGDSRFALFSGAFKDDGQDYALSDGQQTQDPREGFDIYAKFERKGLQINARYQERRFEDFFQFNNLGNGLNFDKTWQASINAILTAYRNDRFKLDVTASHIKHRWRAVAKFFDAGTPLPNLDDQTGAPTPEVLPLPKPWVFGPGFKNFDDKIGVEMNYTPNERHNLIAGVFYRDTENRTVDNLSNYQLFYSEPFTALPDPDQPTDELRSYTLANSTRAQQDRQVRGFYVQDKITFDESFTLFLGARYDSYSDIVGKDDTFNPRGGLIYNAPNNAVFKALYGSAFRAPSLSELHQESPVTEPNPLLKPEEVETFELVYIQNLSSGQFGVTAFYNYIDDVITFVPDSNKFGPKNLGNSKFAGLELELQLALGPHFFLRGSYTNIFDAEVDMSDSNDAFDPDDGDPTTFREYGAVSLNYQRSSFNANLSAIYRGTVKALPDQNAYFLTYGKIRYQASPSVAVDISAKNLFDEEYFTYGPTAPNSQVLNRGREASLGVTVKY